MCNNKDELDVLVAKYRKLSALKKKIEESRKSVTDEIIDYATRKGTVGGKNNATLIVFGDGYKVSVITINNPVWDSDKLKGLLGDDYADYQKSSSYPKLDIR